MTDPQAPDPRALAAVLRGLRRVMDDGDALSPHAVLVTDPETGTRHVVGPYPSRLSAKIGGALVLGRMIEDDPDLANLTCEVVLSYDPAVVGG